MIKIKTKIKIIFFLEFIWIRSKGIDVVHVGQGSHLLYFFLFKSSLTLLAFASFSSKILGYAYNYYSEFYSLL